MIGRGNVELAAGRYNRLFVNARRQFDEEVKAIFARHAADGLLKSGKTIRVVVRALNAATMSALDDALAGISAVTEHAGRSRKRLLGTLSAALEPHQAEIAIHAETAITKIGLGADFIHAHPLIDEANARQAEKITDFAEGWTAPAAKPWKDRHPLLFYGATVAIGIMLGWLGKTILG